MSKVGVDFHRSTPTLLHMSKPWEINCESCLIIPDIHQAVDWAEAIISHERGNFDRLLFNGDIIDSRVSCNIVGARKTGEFFKKLLDQYDVNLGNHDIPVMESWHHNSQYRKKREVYYSCSGFSNSKSMDMNKALTWEDWRKATLFRMVNGWFVSHAGITSKFLKPIISNDDQLEYLWKESQRALDNVALIPHTFLEAGSARCRPGMARQSHGGMTWLDFDYEFDDSAPWPQIVGHTNRANKVRRIGRSYCIDGLQTTYCLIARDGTPTFKSMKFRYIDNPILKSTYEPCEAIVIDNDKDTYEDGENP